MPKCLSENVMNIDPNKVENLIKSDESDFYGYVAIVFASVMILLSLVLLQFFSSFVSQIHWGWIRFVVTRMTLFGFIVFLTLIQCVCLLELSIKSFSLLDDFTRKRIEAKKKKTHPNATS